MKSFKDYFILQEGARIQHAEDIVFWEGSRGALRAISSIMDLRERYKDVTIKWDGSPAVVFGRDQRGRFIFTDKNGFTAKTYNGKCSSVEELQTMLLSRGAGRSAQNESYITFIENMVRAFKIIKKALPKEYRGFVKGDMLYFNTPKVFNNNYIFTPNIVQYAVAVSSDLGKQIGKSVIGVVLHREIDEQGNETPLQDHNILAGRDVLVVPPISVETPPEVDKKQISELKGIVSAFATKIDKLLEKESLVSAQLSDLPNIFYRYTNSKVDTGLDTLGLDFMSWLDIAGLTDKKKNNIKKYISENMDGFTALWQIVNGVMRIKDNIITQFDKRSRLVTQTIDGAAGGEGYVLASTGGDIKLVPREHFSRANRARQR